jgi:hypothetical protein
LVSLIKRNEDFMLPNPCDDIDIKNLDIHVRSYNMLILSGLSKVKDLLALFQKGRVELRASARIGEGTLQQILGILEQRGCLPANLPPEIDIRTQTKKLLWLARTQDDNGSWYDEPETSLAALLSAVRAKKHGNTAIEEASVVKGINWLARNIKNLEDPILQYAYALLLAEIDKRQIADCPFDRGIYSKNDLVATNLEELRRIALVRGNATKRHPWYSVGHRSGRELGPLYTFEEIAWMSVSPP